MSEIHHNGSNDDTSSAFEKIDTRPTKDIYVPDYIDTIFQRLDAQDVEYFYQSYHFWSLQQRSKTLHTEISIMQQAIADNNTLMLQVQPSAIALASLAQLQASGVNDLNLLDRMIERGETWLDHTMQLLEQCEGLDVIGGDYTQWCEHALEGAYDWVESINATNTLNASEDGTEISLEEVPTSYEQQMDLQAATEEQLLQKLMSDEEITLGEEITLDEEITVKVPVPSHLFSGFEQIESPLPTRKITQPLQSSEQETIESPLPTRKITQPLQQPEQDAAVASLPDRKNTQPLLQLEAPTEAEVPETPPTDEIEDIELPLLQEPVFQEAPSPSSDPLREEQSDISNEAAITASNPLLEEPSSISNEASTITNQPLLEEQSSASSETPTATSEPLLEEQPDISNDTSTTTTNEPLLEEQSYVSNEVPTATNEPLQEEPSAASNDTSVPQEETEEGVTQKMVASQREAVTTFKDADVQEVDKATEDEAAISEEDADQTPTDAFAIIEVPQGNKKPQIQEVRQRGFWHWLSRLFAFILGR